MDADTALAAHLAGDLDGAFGAFVAAHQDRAYSIALRLLGDPRDAEEVAQDAFVRAYRALAGMDAPAVRSIALRPWLATIVVRLSRNRRRRLADRHPPTHLDATHLDRTAGPLDLPDVVAARRVTTDALAGLLAALPPSVRAAVVLRHVGDLSYAEASAVLGRPEGTVKAAVHRGLALLRAALAAEEAVEAHAEGDRAIRARPSTIDGAAEGPASRPPLPNPRRIPEARP